MNWIDFVILIILVFALFRGFTDGLVKELASLLALVLGIWGAIKFSGLTAEKLYDFFDMTGKYVGILAFVITLVILVLIIQVVGVLADRFIKAISLGFLNRLLGMVFGVIKTALILSIIFVVLNAIHAKHPFLPEEKIKQSKFYNPIADLAPAIFPIIGEGANSNSFDRFKKKPDGVMI